MRDWLPAWVGHVRTQRLYYYYPPTLAILLNMSSLALVTLNLPPAIRILTGRGTVCSVRPSLPPGSGTRSLRTQPWSPYCLTSTRLARTSSGLGPASLYTPSQARARPGSTSNTLERSSEPRTHLQGDSGDMEHDI